jgi:hypothetical protein
MKELIIITYLSLTLLMGGTGLISDQQEVVQVEQPALNGFTLMTNKGPLDISEKGALFIYPDVGSRDVLRAVKDLPEEKRPYIIIHSGTAKQAEQEFKKVGLDGEEYYFLKGESPADTVPSLFYVENGKLKKSLCSLATEKLDEWKYPILLSSAEVENKQGASGHNAIQAAKSIDGAIVKPGEEFSFYEYVGVCSIERGYKVGRSIMRTPEGIKMVPDVGGGICRTSTVLNFAVKNCPGLEVTERHCHSMPVSYAKPGEDTAVARSSGWDYRFVNNREKPIQIKASWDDNSLKMEIWELYKV